MSEETGITEQTLVTVGMESDSTRMESQAVTETQITNAEGVATRMTVDMEETMPRPLSKTDSPSKRKGNITFYLSSHHFMGFNL